MTRELYLSQLCAPLLLSLLSAGPWEYAVELTQERVVLLLAGDGTSPHNIFNSLPPSSEIKVSARFQVLRTRASSHKSISAKSSVEVHRKPVTVLVAPSPVPFTQRSVNKQVPPASNKSIPYRIKLAPHVELRSTVMTSTRPIPQTLRVYQALLRRKGDSRTAADALRKSSWHQLRRQFIMRRREEFAGPVHNNNRANPAAS